MVLGTVNPEYSYSRTVALVPHARFGVRHCGSWDMGRMEGGHEVGTARRMGSVTLGSSSSPGSQHRPSDGAINKGRSLSPSAPLPSRNHYDSEI